MTPSLVGSAGTVVTGTAGSAVTPLYGTGENHSSGNLGILYVVGFGGTTSLTAPTGWTVPTGASNSATNGVVVGFFWRALDGSATDVPTTGCLAGVTSTRLIAQLAEFTGSDATSALVASSGASNAGTGTSTGGWPGGGNAGNLVIATVGILTSSGAETITPNVGTMNAFQTTGQNNATSTTDHYTFGDCIANASPTFQGTFSFSGQTITEHEYSSAAFTVSGPPSPVPFAPRRMPLGA